MTYAQARSNDVEQSGKSHRDYDEKFHVKTARSKK